MSLPFLDQFEIVNFTLVQDLNLWQLLAMLLYFGLGNIYCQKLLKICFFFYLQICCTTRRETKCIMKA